MKIAADPTGRKLPWWTWVVPLFVFHLGTQLSLLFQLQAAGSSLFYFPTPIALVLVFWWGPRILPAFYINAVISAGLWGLSRWYFWPLYGIPETLFAFLAWYFFAYIRKGAYWFPDTRQFISFLMWVIACPLLIYKVVLELLFIVLGDHPAHFDSFLEGVLTTGLGEFISNVGLSIPALYFFSARMQRRGLTQSARPMHQPAFKIFDRPVMFYVEAGAIVVLLLVLSFVLDFEKFWFVYCLVSLYAAIRFGFGPAILMNLYIFMITYILPLLVGAGGNRHYIISDISIVNVYIGNSMLYVFAAITGRVISDLRLADQQLQQKNKELEQTNAELDHFVYSTSHDLSAPLKSIRGLVSISRLSNDTREKESYFTKIETSVLRLELFIGEVLDYSRNKRMLVSVSSINLAELFAEILDNLRYVEGYPLVQIDTDGVRVREIQNDKTRLKIIFNNLLSNAIKFQRRHDGHTPFIRITTDEKDGDTLICIEDNGEGIRKELEPGLFKMFFRATQTAKGSGLGLYIAKEAADKIGGTISVDSAYGVGSKFTLRLKPLTPPAATHKENP